MRKWLLRILWGVLALFVIMSVAGYFLRRSWGADVAELKVVHGDRSFLASRDETGVWKIQAGTPADLWFAFGYVQAVDREFQTELFRAIAMGRLGELVGKSQIKRDRFMRLSSRVARDEWERLGPDSPVRLAAEAYVEGRRAFLESPPTPAPVEYKLFNLQRSSFEAWEPWHVIAISRFHSWEFSYDFQEEARSLAASKALGPELLSQLFPGEPAESDAMYGQPDAKPAVQSKALGRGRVATPAFFSPNAATASRSPLKEPASGELLAERDVAWLDEKWNGTDLGASNAWLVSDARVGLEPTLCNDTHLGFSWPSALYPVRYALEEGKVAASGFMLPGLPIVVIGNVNTGGDRSLAWGITMASFADVQDLVALEPATVAKARKVPETFRFRDPRTGLLSEESVVDEWTDFGPRVDSFVAGGEGRPLSLDWLGYRRTPSTMDFFVQRNLHGARDLREDLSERWSYPAVNFFWVERSGSEPTVSGHAVTGLLFDRARSGERRPISEREARGRRLSQPSERPWLEKKADGEAFFVVSGNQRVWTGELSRRTASEWYDGARAGAILADFKKAVVKPEASQTDFRSPSLLRFTREARKAVSSDRLCAEMGSQLMVACQRLLSALDSWDGALEVDDWVPSVAAGWYARTKAELWPADRRKLDEDTSAAFQAWHRSNSSNRALLALFSDASKWEKTTGRNFRDVLVDSYRANLNALMNERGPLTEQWSWGGVHRLAWQHPAALAPEPLGTYLRDGLLGPAPIVPGGLDSPGRFDFTWSPDKPLEFPARHGAVMRFCATPLGGGKTRVRWSSVTGASGNPFSDWSKKLAEDSYFKGLLHELKDN